MLKEFKPNKTAFHISQNYSKEPKAQSRLYKWVCNCGFIIRCGDRSLKAVCKNCNSAFICETPIKSDRQNHEVKQKGNEMNNSINQNSEDKNQK